MGVICNLLNFPINTTLFNNFCIHCVIFVANHLSRNIKNGDVIINDMIVPGEVVGEPTFLQDVLEEEPRRSNDGMDKLMEVSDEIERSIKTTRSGRSGILKTTRKNRKNHRKEGYCDDEWD